MKQLAVSAFAKLHKVAKTTVFTHAKAHGINTSEGLTLDDCHRLQRLMKLRSLREIEAHFVNDESEDHQLAITPVTVVETQPDNSMIPSTFSLDIALENLNAVDDEPPIDLDAILNYHTQTNAATIDTIKAFAESKRQAALKAESVVELIEDQYQETALELKVTASEARQAMEREKIANRRLKALTTRKAALGTKPKND